jgi:hypothetical protein
VGERRRCCQDHSSGDGLSKRDSTLTLRGTESGGEVRSERGGGDKPREVKS